MARGIRLPGEPGFCKVADEQTLLIPDWPGNNRLDSLSMVERYRTQLF